jgi:uncharacterized protein (TIGR00266 family)
MQHRIMYRPSYALAVVDLAQGESMRTEAGAMVAMSPTLDLEAKMEGGLLSALGRSMLAGESLFQSTFHARRGGGELMLAPSTPGDIMGFEINNQSFLVAGGSWLASATSIKVETKFSSSGWKTGEGAFMIRVSGSGLVLLSSYGAIHKLTLAPGEEYIIDTGHLVAFQEGLKVSLQKAAKGFFSSVASGEGWVSRFTGPGDIYIQSRTIEALARVLMPHFPARAG